MFNDREHTLFVEKYRPTSLDTFVGNEHLKTKVADYLANEDIPHLLFHGKSGVGKTTLAKILVNSIECDYLYINASDSRNIDTVRGQLTNFASAVGFHPLKIIILDEADYLNPTSAQPALRNLMETFSLHTRFILTGNYVERIIDPIQSRCQVFHMEPPSKKEVAHHVVNILNKEEISHEIKDVALYINSNYPDIRRILNSIQKQVHNGELVVDQQKVIEADYKLQLLEILKSQDKRDAFKNIRQLLADNQMQDYSEIYRLLYDELDQYGTGHIAAVILSLAEGQRDDVIVVDKEINFMSTMIRILNEIK